jgi:anti-anti-sigma factor
VSDDREFCITSSMDDFGVLTLKVAGELDADTSHLLTAELGQWLGISALIVDLHDCTFVDSRGLTALLGCRREIGAAAPMRLLGVAPNIDHTLRLAGLEGMLGLDLAS